VTIPLMDLAALHASIRDALDDAIRTVVDSGRFVLGDELAAFEEEFASYCGVEHCVGVASGTDALILALRACGVGPGDEVITPSFTYVAAPFAIVQLGAVPVFVDVREADGALDVDLVSDAITARTRAVVPVHLYGRCSDLSPLAALAAEHELWLIEDAAQAHGARWKGRVAGSMGHVGCFSFYPSKNLGALGDGGAVVTGDAALAARLRLLRNYGQTEKYRHETLGFNSRLDELQAAVLRRKLPYLDGWNEARRSAARTYAGLLDPALRPPGLDAGPEHVFHLYVVQAEGRDALRRDLAEHGVETRVHYPLPAHLQPAFRGVPHIAGPLPVTEQLAREVLSLPMFPTISERQIHDVADRARAATSRR
jgi:dTDP-3-amino-3,4,6-trideoxy-alpha-D-glucose transaminase